MPGDAPSAMPRAWTRRFVTQQGPQFARTGAFFFARGYACLFIPSALPDCVRRSLELALGAGRIDEFDKRRDVAAHLRVRVNRPLRLYRNQQDEASRPTNSPSKAPSTTFFSSESMVPPSNRKPFCLTDQRSLRLFNALHQLVMP
jgi:hypothetical protein